MKPTIENACRPHPLRCLPQRVSSAPAVLYPLADALSAPGADVASCAETVCIYTLDSKADVSCQPPALPDDAGQEGWTLWLMVMSACQDTPCATADEDGDGLLVGAVSACGLLPSDCDDADVCPPVARPARCHGARSGYPRCAPHRHVPGMERRRSAASHPRLMRQHAPCLVAGSAARAPRTWRALKGARGALIS